MAAVYIYDGVTKVHLQIDGKTVDIDKAQFDCAVSGTNVTIYNSTSAGLIHSSFVYTDILYPAASSATAVVAILTKYKNYPQGIFTFDTGTLSTSDVSGLNNEYTLIPFVTGKTIVPLNYAISSGAGVTYSSNYGLIIYTNTVTSPENNYLYSDAAGFYLAGTASAKMGFEQSVSTAALPSYSTSTLVVSKSIVLRTSTALAPSGGSKTLQIRGTFLLI